MATSSTETFESIQWTRVHWPWLLVTAAWGVAVGATLDGQDWLLNHHVLIEGGHFPLLVAGLVFLLAWQLMIVAMMLPFSMTALRLFRQGNDIHGGDTAAFLAGYAFAWTWFAVIAFNGDILIHQLIHTWSWLAWHPWTIAGTTLLIAGAFQFTPLKEHCLSRCRNPVSCVTSHEGRLTRAGWRLGVAQGTYAVGCCWALMLVMFGLGVGNVVWMAGLAAVMLVEKTVVRGRRLVMFVGGVIFVWGALVLMHPFWLPAPLAGGAS